MRKHKALKTYALPTILCIICMALFYIYGPKREKIKVVEKEVEVIVEKEVIVTKRDVVRVKETKPDGTVIETETDKSVIDTNIDKNTNKTTDKVTLKQPAKNDWSVGIGTIITPGNGGLYVTVERRIIGEISIGIMAITNKTVGVHASIKF